MSSGRVVWSFDEHPGRFANGKLLLYYRLGLFELPPISAMDRTHCNRARVPADGCGGYAIA